MAASRRLNTRKIDCSKMKIVRKEKTSGAASKDAQQGPGPQDLEQAHAQIDEMQAHPLVKS